MVWSLSEVCIPLFKPDRSIDGRASRLVFPPTDPRRLSSSLASLSLSQIDTTKQSLYLMRTTTVLDSLTFHHHQPTTTTHSPSPHQSGKPCLICNTTLSLDKYFTLPPSYIVALATYTPNDQTQTKKQHY